MDMKGSRIFRKLLEAGIFQHSTCGSELYMVLPNFIRNSFGYSRWILEIKTNTKKLDAKEKFYNLSQDIRIIVQGSNFNKFERLKFKGNTFLNSGIYAITSPKKSKIINGYNSRDYTPQNGPITELASNLAFCFCFLLFLPKLYKKVILILKF